MRSRMLAIMKKEISRFFGDKRMVMTSLIFPGVMIYVLYSFMGQAMSNLMAPEEGHEPVAYAIGLPSEMEGPLALAGAPKASPAQESEAEGIKEKIAAQEADLLAVFPPGFLSQMSSYTPSSGLPAPNVELYYNSVSTTSDAAQSAWEDALASYENGIANLFDVNRGEGFDMASDEDTASFVFSMMLPLLLTIFLFSSSLALAPESIAGEKERGTIATLLVTPIGRGELALGKIFSLAILAFLCGMSSTLGTLLSLPKMMQMQGAPGGAMGMGLYGAKDYLLLAAVIFSTILFYVTAMSIVSAYAKSIKEAQNAITPLMIVVMVAGVSSMFGTVQERAALYLVPVYNSVQSMAGIFSFSYSPANVAIAVGANLAYSAVGALALTKMFNMEKVIFSR